jgi:tripartite-type tricarboxylate transporter receptor subunit TctC
VVLTNWRGVLAPSDISDADREALIGVVTELHDGEAWTEHSKPAAGRMPSSPATSSRRTSTTTSPRSPRR